MTWYELLLFLHIVAVIVWLGSGLLIQILATRAERADDAEGLRRVASDSAALGETLFIPASLATVIFGVLLVIDGPWSFDTLWIVLGLAGYLGTFLTGILVMKPGSEKIAAIMERDQGVMSAEAEIEIRKLLTKGRLDTVVLYLVVAVMALKPTGDDVGFLVALAAIVVAGAAYVILRLRQIDEDAAQPATLAH
jgi:uncharacterized membrane protein